MSDDVKLPYTLGKLTETDAEWMRRLISGQLAQSRSSFVGESPGGSGGGSAIKPAGTVTYGGGGFPQEEIQPRSIKEYKINLPPWGNQHISKQDDGRLYCVDFDKIMRKIAREEIEKYFKDDGE